MYSKHMSIFLHSKLFDCYRKTKILNLKDEVKNCNFHTEMLWSFVLFSFTLKNNNIIVHRFIFFHSINSKPKANQLKTAEINNFKLKDKQ